MHPLMINLKDQKDYKEQLSLQKRTENIINNIKLEIIAVGDFLKLKKYHYQ